MSAQKKPNLWRVLSDTWRIIRSNSLHFFALSLLFLYPISLLTILYTSTLHPSATPLNSHYRRLLSAVSTTNNPDPQIPPFQKSQFLSQILYVLISLTLNLCSVSTITYSVFNLFHSQPIKLSDSLRSILSSFFPLLATKLAYLLITAAIALGFGFCLGFLLIGLQLLGFEIDAGNKSFLSASIVVMMAVLVYLGVKWFLTDAIVVVESTYGFAPFKRSSDLMKGAGGVGFMMMVLIWIPGMILSGQLLGGRSDHGGCSGGVVVGMVVYAVCATVLSVFSLAAKTVFLVHCKALNDKFDKLGEVYVRLPHDVVDEV